MKNTGLTGSIYTDEAIPTSPEVRDHNGAKGPTVGAQVMMQGGEAVFGYRTASPMPPSPEASSEAIPVYEICKRAMDIAGALLLLLLAFPLVLVAAVLVGTTSRGPILFKQKRLGRGGKEFWCYKFRTMAVDAEEQLKKRADLQQQFEAGFKIKNDPRITPCGAFLRKTSIDELPQIFNVLFGQMSLIGPRPIVPRELSKYGLYGDKLLTVKPGLGGMWQASGRSDTSYETRIELDMDYIDRRSVWLDVQLLAKTALALLRIRGAY